MLKRLNIQPWWLVAIFIGGALGGAGRYWVSLQFAASATLWGTTAVNLLGSFLLAFTTYGLDMVLDLPDGLLLGLGTGVIGGFTTFSTLMLNVVTGAVARPAFAAGMLLLNLLGGLALAWAGYGVAKLMERGRRLW